MKKKIIVVIVLILLAGLAGKNVLERTSAQPDEASKAIRQQPNTRGESENIFAEPEQAKPRKEYSFTATEESTAYDLMQKLKTEGQIAFTEKTYAGMGKIIDSIGGIRSGGDYTWIYYVNGAKANIGISNYQLKPGDVISWKYEEVLSY